MCHPTFPLRRAETQEDTVATAAQIHGVYFAMLYEEKCGICFFLSASKPKEKNTSRHTQRLVISLFPSFPVDNLGEGRILVSLTDACNIWKLSSTPTDSPGMQTVGILQQGTSSLRLCTKCRTDVRLLSHTALYCSHTSDLIMLSLRVLPD